MHIIEQHSDKKIKIGDIIKLPITPIKFVNKYTSKGPLNLYCRECNMRLKDKKALNRHIAVLHDPEREGKVWKCEPCDRTFPTFMQLRNHELNSKRHYKNK